MIAITTLDGICEAVTRYGFNETGISKLRTLFADVHLVFCLDDEMGAAPPFRSYACFCLYLIQAGGHCMSLTEDPDSAFGVVIAEVERD